jgi:intracellular septation protein
LNLVIAFNASERTWVNFKVFGLTAATFVFIGAQIAWLSRRIVAPVQRA